MIGVEYCTYVPDYNASLSDITEHLKHITDEVHTSDISISFEWLETMIGRWGTNIV